MKLPQLMIFDMDGLIFDTERLFRDMLMNTASQYGYTITEEMYVSTIGMSGTNLEKKMISYFGEDYPFSEISHKARQALNEYARENSLPIKPGIINLLNFFQEKLVKCCVCSSTHSPYVKEYLKLARIDKYFDFVIGGEMVSNSKPSPDIFLKACEITGRLPKDCLVIEDSQNGLLAAINASIPAVCVPDLKMPDEEILKKTACVINQADCLIDIFEC